MSEPPIDEFLQYLRKAAVPERYLPLYEQEVRRFVGAFPSLALHQIGHDEVEDYLRRAARAGATEQRIRNLRVAAEALVAFLRQRRQRPAPRRHPSGRHRREREHRRVTFIRDVQVAGLGGCRSSDLSSGGLFLETLTAMGMGTVLDLTFRIETEQPPIRVSARVVYEHPQLGVGLVFLDVPTETQEMLDRFVESQPESARVG